jgi:hypothetical protein
MKSFAFVLVVAGLLVVVGSSLATPLPPGHPTIKREAPEPSAAKPADPLDVQTPEAVVTAYYASVSGPSGAPRQWDRFRSLFAPEARLARSGAGDVGVGPITLTPEQFVQANRRYFERGGYFERQVSARVETYGRIAHVFSTYESRRKAEDEAPYSRGINSFQLMLSGGRWWIVSVMWDYERAEGPPIPARYLPPEAAEDG